MTSPEDTPAVIRIDLRSGAEELTSARALRDRVAEQLGRSGLPEPEYPLFLVVDTPAGLTGHQLPYELLTGYRAVGETRILVLLVGSSPGSPPGEEDAYLPDRRLVRPTTLRASSTGLLWAGDLRSARTALERPEPDDPAALAVLVDLLSVPDVFLRVLDDLRKLPEAVAAPGVRLLEQDLSAEVRDRAWRDALSRFAGEDGGSGGPADTTPDTRLPEPLRVLVTGSADRRRGHRLPDGEAHRVHRTCAESLRRADEDLDALRAFPGLLHHSRRTAVEADLRQAREDLDAYRALVERALRGGGGGASAPTAEATARLGALGLRVPPADSAGERVGEGLRELAGALLGDGLALRSVAQEFTALAGRVEPVPGTALLHRLADHSEEAVNRRSATEYAAPARTSGATLLLAGAAGLLGGLWPWPALLTALLVPVLFAAVAVLGTRRLRSGRRTARWPLGPRVAAVAGAAAGAAVGHVTAPPLWLGGSALLIGLGLAAEAVRRLWRDTADAWAEGRGTNALRTALDGLDALLAELVQEHWAAEERLYCADAARSVAGMLRATANAAEAQAAPGSAGPVGPADPAGSDRPGGSRGSDAYADDDWLSAPLAPADAGSGVAAGGADDGDWAAAYAWDGDRDGPSGESRDRYEEPYGTADDDPASGGRARDRGDDERVAERYDGPYGDDPFGDGAAPGTGDGGTYGRTGEAYVPVGEAYVPVGEAHGDGPDDDGFGDPYDAPAASHRAPDDAAWQDAGSGRAPRWLDREIGEGGPELVATLAGDLRRTAMAAMAPYWGAVERGQAGALAVSRTEQRVRELLSAARHHLSRHGVLAPPPYPADHRARATAAGLLGTDSARVAELVAREADRGTVVQLSSPEQGSLLSRNPGDARWIRFAPATLRPEIETAWRKGASPQPAEALWTSSGRYAGLIRLVPLREGVVDTVLPRQRGDDDAPAYARADADEDRAEPTSVRAEFREDDRW
ncbi:hypothetical protein [Streptomyces californicus]|uniref:hypothetical protein n=1 Tax=Streptomyces californicus TaxID=67351 RepID=UPI0036D20026